MEEANEGAVKIVPGKDGGLGILKSMGKIMENVGAIEEKDYNAHNKYHYRGIKSVLAAFQPMFVQYDVLPMLSSVDASISDSTYRARWTMTLVNTVDGSRVEIPYSMAGKSMPGGLQLNGSAASYAFKDILFKTFSIPVEQDDADSTNFNKPPETEKKVSNKKPAKPKAGAKPKADKKEYVQLSKDELEGWSADDIGKEFLKSQKAGVPKKYLAMLKETGMAKRAEEKAASKDDAGDLEKELEETQP